MNINQLKTHVTKRISEANLKLVLIFLSLLLCAWMMHIQRGRINIDAVLYLESAKLIATGNWHDAIQIYNWPFYSTCIAAIHLITGLDFLTSAQALNIIFFGIATASFLTIISLAGGGRLELLFGALILFSTRHIVGVMLSMPMRDQGFWALLLTAIVFFIRFVKFKKLSDALLWQICIVIATLYRIEGASYLVLLPITLFCISPLEKKWRAWLSCYIIPISIFLGLCLISIFTNSISTQNLGRLHELTPYSLWDSLTKMLISQAGLMSDQILGKYLGDHAVESLLISFLLIVIIESIKAIGFINFGLVINSVLHKRNRINQNVFNILAAACIISIINLMFIVTSTFILVGRYAGPIGLILIILASFSIRPLIYNYQRKKIMVIAVTIFLLIFTGQNIVKNITPELHQLFYVKEAVIWLESKNSTHKPILYDDMLARFYANKPFLPEVRDRDAYIQQQLSSRAVFNYQYIALNFEGDKEHLTKERLMKPLLPYFHEIKRFNNQKNNKYVIIYEKNTQNSQENILDNVR